MKVGMERAVVIDVACCRKIQNAKSRIRAPVGDVAERMMAAADPRDDCYCSYLTLESKRASVEYGEAGKGERMTAGTIMDVFSGGINETR